MKSPAGGDDDLSSSSPVASPNAVLPADHWYGMVVAVCVFFCQFGIYGTMNSYSTFAHLLEKDSVLGFPSATQVSVGSSVTNGLSSLLTIFGGIALDTLGPRFCLALCCLLMSTASFASSFATSMTTFIVIYSIPSCLASAFLAAPGAAAVSSWLDKRLPLGMGIAYSGNGAGSSVIVLLAGYLAGSQLGWRQSFRWMAICPAIGFVAAMFLKPRQPLRPMRFFPADERRFMAHLFCCSTFQKLWLAAVFFSFTFFSVLYMVVPFALVLGETGGPYAQYQGIKVELAVTLFTWFGVVKWVSSVLLGAVASRLGTTSIYCVGSASLFVACVLWPLCTSYAELAAVVSLSGFGVAGIFATMTSLTGQFFNGPYRGLAMGLVTSGYAVGGFTGPPVIQALRVASDGVYTPSFVLMAVCAAISGGLVGYGIRHPPEAPYFFAQDPMAATDTSTTVFPTTSSFSPLSGGQQNDANHSLSTVQHSGEDVSERTLGRRLKDLFTPAPAPVARNEAAIRAGKAKQQPVNSTVSPPGRQSTSSQPASKGYYAASDGENSEC